MPGRYCSATTGILPTAPLLFVWLATGKRMRFVLGGVAGTGALPVNFSEERMTVSG